MTQTELTLQQGQSIRIGSDIVLCITTNKRKGRGSNGNAAAIGIDAPRDVSIKRAELLERRAS